MAATINECPVRWQAIHHGSAIAIQTDQQKISYSELDQRLTHLQLQLSTQLTAAEQQPIRLVCIASNSLELILLQLLCIRSDWLFCPLNPRFKQAEIKQRLAILGSKYCWVCPNSASQHQNANSLTINFVTNDGARTKKDSLLKTLNIQPMLPCNIIFTSGSSGFPKAIVHNYRNHFYSALGSQTIIPLQQGDNNFQSLPLFHIGGYATVIRSIIAGASIHLTQSDLSTTLLQSRYITHLSLVSTQLTRLLSEANFTSKLSSIKHILLGGSAFSDSQLTELASRDFNYHLSYGCTEMASQIATSINSSKLSILPYREVKIANKQIFLRGKTRLFGYYRNQKVEEIAEQEWIASGDLGIFYNGYLQIAGRKDRQFISGGENIQPEEIERVCLQQKYVKQVYACPINDPIYGQRVALFAQFSQSSQLNFKQQSQQLAAFLKTQLSRFKQPDKFLPWPKLLNNNQTLKVPQKVFLQHLKAKNLI